MIRKMSIGKKNLCACEKPLHRYAVVLVEWMDASSYDGWKDLSDLDIPTNCVTAGLLLRKTKQDIFVGNSVADTGQVYCVMQIPLRAIRKLVTLKKGS